MTCVRQKAWAGAGVVLAALAGCGSQERLAPPADGPPPGLQGYAFYLDIDVTAGTVRVLPPAHRGGSTNPGGLALSLLGNDILGVSTANFFRSAIGQFVPQKRTITFDLTLTAGTHPITAIYSGDATFTGSTSATVSQVANQLATTTSLALAVAQVNPGTSITLTVTVTSPSGSPTGTVTLRLDGIDLTASCNPAVLVPAGDNLSSQALCSFIPAIGSHTYSAIYSGDATYTGSASLGLDVTGN